MPSIVPHKIMISFNELGTFKDGIFIYRILSDTGELTEKYKTIKVNSEMSVPVINNIIQKAINFAKQREGI